MASVGIACTTCAYVSDTLGEWSRIAKRDGSELFIGVESAVNGFSINNVWACPKCGSLSVMLPGREPPAPCLKVSHDSPASWPRQARWRVANLEAQMKRQEGRFYAEVEDNAKHSAKYHDCIAELRAEVAMLRGGAPGPYERCSICGRGMVWANRARVWVCPDCVYERMKSGGG